MTYDEIAAEILLYEYIYIWTTYRENLYCSCQHCRRLNKWGIWGIVDKLK